MKKFFQVILLLFSFLSIANFIPPVDDSYLTSSFAEFRSTGNLPHFHGGIDFSTFSKEGIPIKAIYEGYVVRIELNDPIYGNVIVLQHPNGYRSLYAHLSSFNYIIQSIVDDLIKEFPNEKIVVRFPEDEILFAQGDIIAYSGKTGEAVKPHSHVEIRNHDETILFDPLDFIKINPPDGNIVLKELIINGKKVEYHKDAVYTFSGEFPKIEINSYLKVNSNLLGLKEIKLYIANKLVYHIILDEIPLDIFYKPYIIYTKDSIAAGYIYKSYYRLYPEAVGGPIKVNNFPTLNTNLAFFQVRIETYDPWGRKKEFSFNLKREM
ncbi:peptidase M23 [Thermosipho melanesiensis]|uniref:Peptidase M23B n=2 Tax=Thermosipho melanesiensis TaxID=46541 RepID=A6LNU6_THEM4|nr:M23 family metallopeptidase [Thermosipho melanesiensis]ABR31597.1 peptidase M23B [Thermosipho melanesiensis BI429]APT74628.1 peptidase M23 [Thermosipho melanesiensis]OOC35333.1 peptidase M23 [Thermosipho melanesiensis]OOC35551.1 peptidase M23 [Thermosipho melanesiensis]OOC36588.1 peptidase M23 [Thermosipho melanesiensis]